MAQSAATPGSTGIKVSGLTIGTKLILNFLGFIVSLAVLLFFAYQQYVPPLVNQQITLRTSALTEFFASVALEPVVTRNYLRLNKIAEVATKLPDVAYVAVVNKKGFAVAGMFGDLQRFSKDFSGLVNEKGFPVEILAQNRVPEGKHESRKEMTVGGQRVFEIAIPIGEGEAEAHIAIFTDNVEQALRRSLYPLLILLAVMALVGAVGIMMLARTVSKPIRQLTEQAHAISMGQLNQNINVQGSGEIGALARSFARMQSSLKHMLGQIKKQGAGNGSSSSDQPKQG